MPLAVVSTSTHMHTHRNKYIHITINKANTQKCKIKGEEGIWEGLSGDLEKAQVLHILTSQKLPDVCPLTLTSRDWGWPEKAGLLL